ncbi:unnamed protein product, partial [Effrenium voratum]
RGMLLELRRSFGLRELCGSEEAPKQLLRRLRSIVRDGGWDLQAAFDSPELPLKLELCSGEGEWVCAQAAKDAEGNWACVEHRRDRVFRTFSRAFLTGVSNLCFVAGDAAMLLQLLAPGSVAQVFVNFPEPPVRRGLGDGDAAGDDSAPHLLTVSTFKLIHRVLRAKGMLLVHSDNVTYLRQLAATIDRAGGFQNAPDPGEAVREGAEDASVQIWRGRPGPTAGVVEPQASSYFDRLWSHGRFKRRYFILVQRQ